MSRPIAVPGPARGVTAEQRDTAIAAARLTKFAASLTRSSMLRDIETVRNAGGGGVSAAPRLLAGLQVEIVRVLDVLEGAP